MTLWVACNSCREPFDAETHAGLLRCPPCVDRSSFRLVSSTPRVIEVVEVPG